MQDWKKYKFLLSENAKPLGFFVGGLVVGVLIISGIWATQHKKRAVDISSSVGQSLMVVDGKTYTASNLPGDANMQFYQLNSRIYGAKQSMISEIGLRIALANDIGAKVSATELPKLSELLKIQPATEADAKNYYDDAVKRIGAGVFNGQSFASLKGEIMKQLSQQKVEQAAFSKAQELTNNGRIKILFTAPSAPPVALDISGYPTRGSSSDDNVLVEVSDYMCPHCRESEDAVERLMNELSGKVKFVQVSYSLAPAGLSGSLARGAFCANKQGNDQFWAYHKLAFQVPFSKSQPPPTSPPNSPQKIFDEVALDVAKNAGLDINAFGSCLESSDAANFIRHVQDEFNASTGFQGTPTFYLNGKMIQVAPQQLEATIRSALN